MTVRVLLAIVLGLCASPLTAAPILSVNPPLTNVEPGDAFSVDVAIEDVVDLYAYQLSVSYDSAILSPVAMTEGPFLANGGASIFIEGDTTIPGLISFIAASLLGPDPGVTGSGVLFSLEFKALAAGMSAITPFFDDQSGDALLDSGLNLIDAGVNPGEVVIRKAVPEPGALLLFSTAVIGIRRWARGASARANREVISVGR